MPAAVIETRAVSRPAWFSCKAFDAMALKQGTTATATLKYVHLPVNDTGRPTTYRIPRWNVRTRSLLRLRGAFGRLLSTRLVLRLWRDRGPALSSVTHRPALLLGQPYGLYILCHLRSGLVVESSKTHPRAGLGRPLPWAGIRDIPARDTTLRARFSRILFNDARCAQILEHTLYLFL